MIPPEVCVLVVESDDGQTEAVACRVGQQWVPLGDVARAEDKLGQVLREGLMADGIQRAWVLRYRPEMEQL